MRSMEFSIITWKKKEEPKPIFHCTIHRCRMIRLADGLRCPICGGVKVATKTVYTHNPSAEAQATQAIKK